MHKIRVLLALVLGILIVGALTIRYRQHPEKQLAVDPIGGLRAGIQKISGRFFGSDSLPMTGQAMPTKPTPAAGIPGLHPDFSTGKIDLADLAKIRGKGKLYGATNPGILLLQRCDFNSTYCLEGYEKGEIFAYVKQFPDLLGYQFKSYPRTNDAITVLQHTAARCAEQLGSAETFMSYYFSIYQAQGKLTQDELITVADRIGIKGMKACLEKTDPADLQDEMKMSRQLFGFKSLPANVLIDVKTGDRLLIPGLYETKDVVDAIERLKKN